MGKIPSPGLLPPDDPTYGQGWTIGSPLAWRRHLENGPTPPEAPKRK